jgi:hypothetical protein
MYDFAIIKFALKKLLLILQRRQLDTYAIAIIVIKQYKSPKVQNSATRFSK